MLHSHSIENEKFGLFILFLNHLLQGNKEYKKSVDDVLLETRALVKGSKDLYTINRDTFPIVVYLKKQAPDFFTALDSNPSNYSNDVYTKISKILEKQHPLSTI